MPSPARQGWVYDRMHCPLLCDALLWQLTRLRQLALRGHDALRELPPWLPRLPLESLELVACRCLANLPLVSRLAGLQTLVLQVRAP